MNSILQRKTRMARSGLLPLVRFSLAFGLAITGVGAAQAAEFNPLDKVSIKVTEWLPARGEYREWSALSGQYSVDADRSISIPFLGRLSLGDLDTNSLAEKISTGLQERMSLPQAPDVQIDVAERAPVYILGAVATPGAVPFVPGMTVRQAIALSGGLFRGSGVEMRLERDAITTAGTLDEARDRANRLRARVYRLEQEIRPQDAAAPSSDATAGIPAELLREEESIRQTRTQVRQSRIKSFEDRRDLAKDQISTLSEMKTSLDRQIQVTRAELTEVNRLVDRGLAVSGRSTTLDRTLADLESRRLDLDLGTLTANLAVNESERGILDVDTSFRIDTSNELQTARAELEKAERDIRVASDLLREATLIAPANAIERDGDLAVDLQVFRSPWGGGAPVRIDLDAPLASRDTVEIRLDMRRGGTSVRADAQAATTP